MESNKSFGLRDLLMIIIGIALGVWLSSLPDLNAQAPPLPSNAQDSGEWVMQTFQSGTASRNAFVLNTRTGELFFLKDEKKVSVKTE